MAVALLRGENFRLYRSLEIQPHSGLNLITGGNAAGKTSLLEALFVAARGRSFRALSLSELCGAERPEWNVFLETDQERHRVGLGWNRQGSEIRLDDTKNARISDVVRLVPIQLIDPLAHRLLDEGPSYRRSFVDWGVFHVEHLFLDVWRRYQRALKQRNSALRDQLEDRAVQAWNEELVAAGETLTAMRLSHVRAASAGLSAWVQRLLGTSDATCEWQRGWPDGEDFRELLDRNLDQHRRFGATIQGPHRAELKVRLNHAKAKGRVSRGQQKLLITAMVLAQAELLAAAGAPAPILLLDDFAAELSTEFQSRLAAALIEYRGQKFVTAFEKPAIAGLGEGGLFHVEHGTIRSLNALHK
ncbi:DNA replication and repair protein RecF [Panacagrimonas perspica]|uniref:DNA replication and repair protein RecF n=1 Tax=Panacagrimonas perspica TaxID=381431 RepID=A0A4V3F5E3_9GAMM|nr:DNA replication/repair protein RecF [Panacagrimonas perspica]TDU28736.1 DNA replication and repair protein RecF [Panacagrimonas perspica]THD05057.1 DNA replication/repair protein RecF [Panacagrimonas perspica]